MPAALNLAGRIFDTLRVLERIPGARDKSGYVMYRCRCKCGHEFKASTRDIRDGRAMHCERPARKPRRKAADPGIVLKQQAAQERVQHFLCHYPATITDPQQEATP